MSGLELFQRRRTVTRQRMTVTSHWQRTMLFNLYIYSHPHSFPDTHTFWKRSSMWPPMDVGSSRRNRSETLDSPCLPTAEAHIQPQQYVL